MLKYSFRQIRGIGAKREQELWGRGVYSWDDFERYQTPQLHMFRLHSDADNLLYDSKRALEVGDADFFAEHLPRQEHHRIALGFPAQTLFLDIESTGLSRYYDVITIVGWSMGELYNVYIKGQNITPLRAALASAKVIVTFNGSLFDLPFLKHEFADIPIPATHVDLRFLSKRVGLSGGQKEVEKTIGLTRPSHLIDLEGVAAPILWYKYKQGDLDALRFLISYNQADVEGMKHILDYAVDRLIERRLLPDCLAPYRFSNGLIEPTRWDGNGFARIKEQIRLPRYKGRRGPLVTLRDLSKRVSQLRIVGIDLTGSEARPSGWCVIHNSKAATRMIGTDDDIIALTQESKPDLVSIDSPLSLPKGRITVTDDDPGRKEYGITRECERVLKRRGVNVYPSLIQSMQNLTARGIRLANTFRKLGIPVIESYPGAAQDILGIPRKRADVNLLKVALGQFGIRGKFLKQAVTHDELDAITSAMVGLFFMNGNFEALGNEGEEYLIIPEVSSDRNLWGSRKVIGLSGPIAAGKTTAGDTIASLGFAYGRYSLVLKQLLEERGIPISRDSLQAIGEEVYEQQGQRWLARRLLAMLPPNTNLVIDGLRHPEDHAFLVETFGPDFTHLHIAAPLADRRLRYITEGSSGEEFERAISHSVEGNVEKLSSLADTTIMNYDSKQSFEEELIKRFGETL